MNAGDRDGPASEQNTSIVESLARETGGEAAHVKELYEREFAKLEATAKVRGFLSRIVQKENRHSSGCDPMVVAEHSAEALSALNRVMG